MRGASKAVLILMAAVLLPSLAFAQGTLTGTVRDESGGVLPGVTVEASSPALIEKVRTALTDGAGQYRITGLNAGTYSLTFRLSGFNIVKREGIELSGTATLTIPAEMRVGAVAETVTVTGETPVVDVQTARRETVLSADVVAAIPGNRSVGTLLNAVPGLTVNDGALAASPTMTFFAARGGPINEGRMTINGMTVAAPFNGGGVSTYILDSVNVDEVAVAVAGGLGESDIGGPVMNLVPRSGGNTFRGQGFFNNAGDWSRGNNLTDELRAVGLTETPGIINSYDASISYGGPIKRDRLWFFGSYRKPRYGVGGPGCRRQQERLRRVALGLGGRPERHGAPAAGARDVHRAVHGAGVQQASRLVQRGVPAPLRGVAVEGRTTDGCNTRERRLDRGRNGDRVARGQSKLFREYAVSRAPGALDRADDEPAAARGRLHLFLVPRRDDGQGPAGRDLRSDLGDRAVHGDQSGDGPAVCAAGELRLSGRPDRQPQLRQPEQLARLGVVRHRVARSEGRLPGRLHHRRLVGPRSRLAGVLPVQPGRAESVHVPAAGVAPGGPHVDGGVVHPGQVDARAVDAAGRAALRPRLELQPGGVQRDGADVEVQRGADYLRADGGRRRVQRHHAALGAAYDVFGNGKTALKFNLGHYLDAATNDSEYTSNSPAVRIVRTAARNWGDTNNNKVVDCDIMNFAQNGECAALTGDALNFGGVSGNLTQVNQETLRGWGVRQHDWQWGITVQQQVIPRVSAEVAYNRRWFHGEKVTDNRLRGPEDYEPFTILAPQDPRLPGGGGYPIALSMVTAAAANRGAQNYVTFETDFGPERTSYWHGVDFTLNARLRQGLTLQFGTQTGRSVPDTCATARVIDDTDDPGHDQGPPQLPRRRSVPDDRPRDWRRTRFQRSMCSSAPRCARSRRSRASPPGQVPNTVIQGIIGRLPPGGLATGNTTIDDPGQRPSAVRRQSADADRHAIREDPPIRQEARGCGRRPRQPAEHQLRDDVREHTISTVSAIRRRAARGTTRRPSTRRGSSAGT